jgi:cytochrome c-type biogenesis protein CcmE
MNPVRRRKLLFILLLLISLGIIVSLVLYALRQNINLFYSPTQLARGEAPAHHAIRAGGMVVPKSIHRSQNDLSVRFKITDYQTTVNVIYRGILPDLFREGQGVIVQGELLDHNHFKAKEVLAKHDEKYMPPEVSSTLKQPKRTT